jgi:MoaA/NifB/PqqE/SkfB family radical SAM enzyme
MYCRNFEQNHSLTRDNVFKNRKKFKPNLSKIELDITYECNLKCLGCNRSCTQAPTKESLSLGDVRDLFKNL